MLSQNQRGQAVPFVVVFTLFMLSMMTMILWLGTAAALRAKAQATADSAALAGAVGGESAAQRVATENKGELTRFEKLGNDARVVVRLGKISATARATNNTNVVNKNLAPALRAAVVRAESIAKKKVSITSSTFKQIEVSAATTTWLAAISDSTGLCQTSTNSFAICG